MSNYDDEVKAWLIIGLFLLFVVAVILVGIWAQR